MLAHLALGFLLTILLALGIHGIGDALVRRPGLGLRWVAGWTVLWWSIALPAQVFGPRAGVAVGFTAASAGALATLVALVRARVLQRMLIRGSAALLVGAPLWLAPPQFYDSLVYHLGLPWSWLVNGSFAPTDHNIFSHFPLAASTVFLLPVAARLPEAAAGLHWLTFVIALSACTDLARNLGAGRWGWLAAVLPCGAWHASWLAGLAGADHLVVLGVVVACTIWTEAPVPRASVWPAAGLALGLALSAKYTAAVPVAGVLLAALMFVRPPLQAVGAGLVALGVSSFWWIRNALEFGNPFHPLLWNAFGGRGWTAEEYARYASLVREGVGGPASWLVGASKLGLPSSLGLWLPLAAIVGLAAVISRRSDAGPARFVGLAALLGIAGWAVTSQTARYALPSAALIGCLAAAGCARLSRAVARACAGVLSLAAAHGIVLVLTFLFGTLALQRAWLGEESREAWRHAVTLDDPVPAYRAAAGALEAKARILVVGEGRSWQCPRPHDVSSPYDTQTLQKMVEAAGSAAELRDRIVAAGFTHLLINWAELKRLGGSEYQVLRFRTPAELDRFRELGQDLTERVWADGPLEIRAIRR